ncbi:MAG: radical SAM protein [Candidatus Cloacimonadaceae bacterium]
MRISQYAYSHSMDKMTILYHTLNKSILMIDRALLKEQIIDKNSFSQDELKILNDFDFFVPNGYNEIEDAKKRLTSLWDSMDTFEIIIHVTNKCNCRCVYCYETGMYEKSGIFGDFTHLDDFLLYCKQAFPYNNAVLSFHGGEPSLYPDTILSLYETVKKHFPKLQTTMVSNGVLLHTRKMLNVLKKIKIDRVLITIDGYKELHDIRRPIKHHGSSFNKILLSLETLRKEKIPIHISTNIDRANYHAIDYVYNEIIKKYSPNNFYFAKVCSGENNPYSMCLSDSEFDEIIADFYKRHDLTSKETNAFYEEYFGTFICSSKSMNVLIIDSFGDVYNCISLTGNKKHSRGNIKDGFKSVYSRIENYMNAVFSSPCKDCIYLPMCYGGCQLAKLTKENNSGCPKKRFDRMLPRVLEWKTIKQLNSSHYTKATE